MLLPNSNTMIIMDELGIWDYLIKAAKEKGADIRVLCHRSNSNENANDIVRRISSQAPSIGIFSTPRSKASLFIVDNEKFLRIEEKDTDVRNATRVSDAISLAIWSNSKKGTTSFKSIFDTLWKQTDLYEQLKVHDKMQKEFINIAAHELRTPIQPILGLSEVLQSKIKDNEQRGLIDIILRNAKRLQRLTEDILDITRIESQSLQLKKEKFNLNEIVISVLTEYGSRTGSKNNVKITFASKGDFIVEGDRGRLGQVLSNIMNNATKFTQEGNIDISLEKLQDDKTVVLSVKDTGSGIDPDIMPRLFTKFATKSHIGTGLGLYISKSIVEAHGGRIWAENNLDGKGATFSFSLPVINKR
jgi:signal transduction histidine kinase